MALRIAVLLLLFVVISVTLANEIGDGDDFPVDQNVQIERAPAAKPPPPAAKPPRTLVNKPKPRGKPTQPEDRTEERGKNQMRGNESDRAGYEPETMYHSSSSWSDMDGHGGHQCKSIRYRNKCYFLALSQESWHTGRDYCNRIGQHLARIDSSDEATFLASYMYEGGHRNYWVDLNDERTEGVWTHSDNSPGFTDWWAPNEPNGNRGENCGLLVIGRDRIGRLVDEPCGEWRRYVCEQRTESVCQRAGYKRKCYWFSAQPATWFNAREYCATIGKRLARVTATDESNFLARVMPRPSWIDLRYGGQGVGWTYADGTSGAAISGLFGGGGYMGGWGGGQRCAELRRYNVKEGRAIGADCNALRQFVCESETLPPGSEFYNPEDMPGSVVGSSLGGPAVGPAGPVNSMDPQMGGGMAGMGPNYGMGMGMGMGMHNMYG